MQYYSTNNIKNKVSLKEAVLKGIADDGGLFMPEYIPQISKDFINNISSYSFQDIACHIAKLFCEEDIPTPALYDIINSAINFESPIVKLDEDTYVLELFHGPTFAFKDFGARFTAKIMSYFINNQNNEINILVATSGDTGSAVANGFFNIPGINVTILYPSNKVSYLQEKQLTTLGGNITALEVGGTFDDCQRLVKNAFADKTVSKIKNLSSANSINISRLLPQSFYYFNAYAQLKNKTKDLLFSVPSGNLGNLTAGLIAYKMGLPVYKFISAVNANKVFEKYINTGEFIIKPSITTFSNAMDVGNPSNAARIFELFENNFTKINNIIFSRSKSDEETLIAIEEVYDKYNYLIDPHGAVGYAVLHDYVDNQDVKYNSIILETAHPAKFTEVMEKAISDKIKLPEELKKCLLKEKVSIKISNRYEEFKEFLIG
ncbi:MAG: threonine synthase [bacterium]